MSLNVNDPNLAVSFSLSLFLSLSLSLSFYFSLARFVCRCNNHGTLGRSHWILKAVHFDLCRPIVALCSFFDRGRMAFVKVLAAAMAAMAASTPAPTLGLFPISQVLGRLSVVEVPSPSVLEVPSPSVEGPAEGL